MAKRKTLTPNQMLLKHVGIPLLTVALLLGMATLGANVGDRLLKKEKIKEVMMSGQEKFARSLQPGDCFREEGTFGTTASFEKSFKYKSHIYVVLAKDENNGALLIAQPHPECEAPEEESDRCVYWFRTVHVDKGNIYLIEEDGDVKVTCPKGLTKNDMIQRLKESGYAKKYRVD